MELVINDTYKENNFIIQLSFLNSKLAEIPLSISNKVLQLFYTSTENALVCEISTQQHKRLGYLERWFWQPALL